MLHHMINMLYDQTVAQCVMTYDQGFKTHQYVNMAHMSCHMTNILSNIHSILNMLRHMTNMLHGQNIWTMCV